MQNQTQQGMSPRTNFDFHIGFPEPISIVNAIERGFLVTNLDTPATDQENPVTSRTAIRHQRRQSRHRQHRHTPWTRTRNMGEPPSDEHWRGNLNRCEERSCDTR